MNTRRVCESNRWSGKFQLAAVMPSFFKYLIAVCISSVVTGTATEPPGFVEGRLKIISPKEVELADGNAPAITAENYAQYPLIILSQDGKKEIARVTADGNGNYRTALPPASFCVPDNLARFAPVRRAAVDQLEAECELRTVIQRSGAAHPSTSPFALTRSFREDRHQAPAL